LSKWDVASVWAMENTFYKCQSIRSKWYTDETCVKCVAGKYASTGSCTACPTGKFSSPESLDSSACFALSLVPKTQLKAAYSTDSTC